MAFTADSDPRRASAHPGTPPGSASPHRLRLWFWLVGALAAVVILGAGAFLLTDHGGNKGRSSGAPAQATSAGHAQATSCGPAHATSAGSARAVAKSGTLYVTIDAYPKSGTVSVIHPDGTNGTTITVGQAPLAAVIAPTGTPNAGTAYVTNDPSKNHKAGTLSIIRPNATTGATIRLGGYPRGVALAP